MVILNRYRDTDTESELAKNNILSTYPQMGEQKTTPLLQFLTGFGFYSSSPKIPLETHFLSQDKVDQNGAQVQAGQGSNFLSDQFMKQHEICILHSLSVLLVELPFIHQR